MICFLADSLSNNKVPNKFTELIIVFFLYISLSMFYELILAVFIDQISFLNEFCYSYISISFVFVLFHVLFVNKII